MIKAVIFDYFGVISSDDYWKFVRHGRGGKSQFRDYADAVNTGELHWQEFVQQVAKSTNTDITEVNKLYAAEQINPLVVGLIHELHKKYKTGLITNASHEFVDEIMDQNHMRDIFDSIVVSSRLGITKPDPRIFQYALKELKVQPEEAIYIDDLVRHVDAADTLGMHAFVFENFEQAKKRIQSILAQA